MASRPSGISRETAIVQHIENERWTNKQHNSGWRAPGNENTSNRSICGLEGGGPKRRQLFGRKRCKNRRRIPGTKRECHPLLLCLNRLTLVSAVPPGTGTLLHPPPEWQSAPELRPTFSANSTSESTKTLSNGQVNWITDVSTGQFNQIQKQSNRSAGDNQIQAGTPPGPRPVWKIELGHGPVRLSASSRTSIKHKRQRSFSDNHASGACIMLIGAITKIHRYTSAGVSAETKNSARLLAIDQLAIFSTSTRIG